MTLFEVSGSWDRSFLTLCRVSNDYVLGDRVQSSQITSLLDPVSKRAEHGSFSDRKFTFSDVLFVSQSSGEQEGKCIYRSRGRRGKYRTMYLRVRNCATINELGRMNLFNGDKNHEVYIFNILHKTTRLGKQL